MCGIAGIFGHRAAQTGVAAMVRAVAHRGPDDSGTAEGPGWALGHTRLAIIDLSGGAQPMSGAGGKVVLIGNHEIYNFQELRRELEGLGHTFRTRSDTEVILEAYLEWGEACFERFSGMFAVAIMDTRTDTLTLARDHVGMKSLFYAPYKDGFAFASECKAILALPGFERAVDRDSLHLFMNFRYVPGDGSLFAGISKCPPGAYMILRHGQAPRMGMHYAIRDHFRPGRFKDVGEAREALVAALDTAVTRHLIADVPVGLYLSGGIDSSTVAAFAARRSPGIQSFCMTFGEPSDEHEDAALVARHLGLTHSTLHVGDNPLALLPEVIWHTEEPKVNNIQGYLLAREVRRHVKVVLGGLGGDELFAGYTNTDILYPMTLAARLFKMRPPARAHGLASLLQGAVGGVGSDFWFRCLDLGLSAFSPVGFYAVLRNAFDHSPHLLDQLYGPGRRHLRGRAAEALAPLVDGSNPDVLGELLLMELRTKMVNDFLLTDDHVSMAHGLEVRLPLLDKDLLNLALSIPTAWKYHRRDKKKILKDAARPLLPPEVFAKRKWGFSFNPYHQFTKDLRPMAERELTRERVEELGVFDYGWVRAVLDHKPVPRMRWHYFNLWVMLGLSVWHRLFIEEGVLKRPAPLPEAFDHGPERT